MDDDIVDLLVISSVAGIGFTALIYLVTKIYSDKIKNRLLFLRKKTKPFFALANTAVAQRPKSILTFQNHIEEGESSRRIPIHSTEHLMKQSTKRVRIEVKDKLDNKSSSNSPKIERLTYALHSSDVNDLVQRRKTL